MSASRIPLLLNRNAGALHGNPDADAITKRAGENGIPIEVIETKSADDARQLLRRLVGEGTERIAIAGGDGTVHLAVQILAATKSALGIIPQGTANNFATALHLPFDLLSALRILGSGPVREVDLGRIGDRYFTESAGVGLFADALAMYGGANKNLPRTLLTLARLFLSLHARSVRLTVDGRTIGERLVWCEVANAYRMAHAVPLAPGAVFSDDELDVVVLGDIKRSELISYYRAIRAQQHYNLPKITRYRGKEIRIEAEQAMNLHDDDEVIGTTPAVIVSAPRALRVLVERV